MQAVILAAGMGKRLGKYTKDRTKCMVEVGGKKLIDRSLDAVKKIGIHRVVVVIGYEGRKLEAYLQGKEDGMEYVFINNEDYANTNNIYSLYLARNELVKDDTILMESDLVFDDKILSALVTSPFGNVAIVAKYEQWMDGTVALLDENDNIVEFVERTDFRFADAERYYKTVNIYKFNKNFLQNQYVPFLEAYIRAYGKNQYYELVLKILAHVRYSDLKAMSVNDYKWYEIDDEQDLRIADVIFSEDEKQFAAYDHQFGGFWRFPRLKDFCYLVNPYYPPPKMIDHMRYFFETLLREYPSGLATQDLNAGRMFHVESQYLVTGNGAAELICALGNITQGKILVLVPAFNEYIRCFQKSEVIELPGADYDYNIPTDIIIRNMEYADAVVLVNPDNPSGNYIPFENIVRIVRTCKAKRKLCIVDESFMDFAEAEKRYTLLDNKILEEYPNLIVVKSISKSYGVPGLRLGILATSDMMTASEIRKNLPIWNINSFAEYFLQIQSLYEKDYKDACDKIACQRKVMSERLAENNLVRVYPSQANFIMCRLLGRMGAKELANRLVKQNDILIKDLSTKKGISGGEYIRVAVKKRQENDMLVDAINEILY